MNVKGKFGYIRAQRKKQTIMTIVCFAISLSIFIAGYVTTKSRLNLLTIVAVLGCLPASKCAVAMIMYYRARECPEAVFQRLQSYDSDIGFLYDLYFTSYKESYPVSVLTVRKDVVAGYCAHRCNLLEGEKHLLGMLKQNGYGNYVVKLFESFDRFEERCGQLRNQSVSERDEGVRELLKQISL